MIEGWRGVAPVEAGSEVFRIELDWLIDAWKAPTPWIRPTLLQWLRYADGCVAREEAYFVPSRCCAQVHAAAHAGRAPGRRAVHEVSGCGLDAARNWLARPELWRDPKVAIIHQLRAEIAMHQRRLSPPTLPPPRSEHRGNRQRGRVASESLRRRVFERDRFTCVYCGATVRAVALQADHYIPWSAGGPTSMDNLVTACCRCNNRKGAKMPDGAT